MEPIHLICVFSLMCSASGICSEDETVLNIRYQPDAEFAEYWAGRSPVAVPWLAVQVTPQSDSPAGDYMHFFAAPEGTWPVMLSLNTQTLAMAATMHLPDPERFEEGFYRAMSGQTTCQVPGGI